METAIVLVVLLVLINGLLSMSELAMALARPARLEAAAAEGGRGARAAINLKANPTRLLSTVQVGITFVAILSGAYGEAAVADRFQAWLETFPAVAGSARTIAFTTMVLGIGFLSIVVGELIPKRLAMRSPEPIAMVMARPMALLARAAAPVVWVTSAATDLLLRLLPSGRGAGPDVTAEDIKGMVQEAAKTGAVQAEEHRLIERVFRLGDTRVRSLMVPRQDVEWVDATDPAHRVRVAVSTATHSHFPVCRGGLDEVVGVVHIKDLVRGGLLDDAVQVGTLMQPPLFVPETAPAIRLLDLFKQRRTHMALVVDEFGSVVGLVTLNDVLESIIGEVLRHGEAPEPEATRRADGSWLVDGIIGLDKLAETLGMGPRLAEFAESGVDTLSGLMLLRLGHIPRPGERLDMVGWRFEVVDLDGPRIDKVLATRMPDPAAEPLGE